MNLVLKKATFYPQIFLFSHQTRKQKIFKHHEKEPEQPKVYPLQYPNLQPKDLAPIISRERPVKYLTPKYDIPLEQFMPNSDAILDKKYGGKWKSPENAYSLNIGLIGPANAGKSQLMGKLSYRVSAVSPKASTTEENIEGIKSFEKDSQEGIKYVQLKYIDTPGLVSKKGGFVSKGFSALSEIDFALLIIDSAKRFDDCIKQSIRRLERHRNYEKFMKALVINKIDLVDNRRKFNSLISSIEKYGKFDKIFYISATTGYGVQSLEDYLIGMAKKKPWQHPPQVKTNLTQIQIYEEMLKQCLYHRLYKEVPYQAMIKCISSAQMSNKEIQLRFDVFVETENQQRMLTGKDGINIINVLNRFKTLFVKMEGKKVRVMVDVKVQKRLQKKRPGMEENIMLTDDFQEAKQKIKIIEEAKTLDQK